jgi:hypothetical protein
MRAQADCPARVATRTRRHLADPAGDSPPTAERLPAPELTGMLLRAVVEEDVRFSSGADLCDAVVAMPGYASGARARRLADSPIKIAVLRADAESARRSHVSKVRRAWPRGRRTGRGRPLGSPATNQPNPRREVFVGCSLAYGLNRARDALIIPAIHGPSNPRNTDTVCLFVTPSPTPSA